MNSPLKNLVFFSMSLTQQKLTLYYEFKQRKTDNSLIKISYFNVSDIRKKYAINPRFSRIETLH